MTQIYSNKKHYKMVTTIYNLPVDVICEHIVTEFDFKTARNVHVAHMFDHTSLDDMIYIFIKNDPVFKTQSFDVYNVLRNSSVPINDFDNIINDIKIGATIQDTICFDMHNLDTNKIENTILIMKLMKRYSSTVSCLGDINNILVKNLMKYISETITHHPKKESGEFLQEAFTKCLENVEWENIDIDIYKLFMSCNLIQKSPRSYQIKSSIENNINLDEYIKNNKKVFCTTVSVFVFLIHHINHVRTNLYIVYELYKYLNHLVKSNPGITSPLNLHTALHNTIRFKAEQFLYQVRNEYRTVLPKYIFNLLVKELEQYGKT